MESVEELCSLYVAYLRAIALVHQNHHWITSGDNFYSNHLLFERIYKTAVEDSDSAAEKVIGVYGPSALAMNTHTKALSLLLNKFSGGDPIRTSIEIEKEFISYSGKFYEILKKEEKMTLGMDDLILGIANNREGALYLLNQTAESKKATRKAAFSQLKEKF